ncbi:MAG: TerB family tellurite resistance protein [Proteobacteria bacterium]|nr:TerB family tellurite resistance protein [Pseudomonadota bacterium]MBS0573451.1 TerB family tellurite resistance protein [Pseudomonadota bacterium]
MFERLLSALTAPHPAPADPAGPLALAALLVRLARADSQYEPAEIARIDRILASRYGISPFEAVQLRERAEALEAASPDTVRFTRALKDAVPHEDRIEILQALWSVALADEERSADEEALIRLVANLLGVSDQDSARARQRVQSR